MSLPRLTHLEYHTLNQFLAYRASHKVPGHPLERISPSMDNLKRFMGSSVSRIAIYYRLKNLQRKGYLYVKEGKFYPTREGISQVSSDWFLFKKPVKPNKGITGYASYRDELLSQKKDG
jgi:hypothetical protein